MIPFAALAIDYGCNRFFVSQEDVIGRSRSPEIVMARREIWTIMRIAGISTTVIGGWFDNRDHTTVLGAERWIHRNRPQRYLELIEVSRRLEQQCPIKKSERKKGRNEPVKHFVEQAVEQDKQIKSLAIQNTSLRHELDASRHELDASRHELDASRKEVARLKAQLTNLDNVYGIFDTNKRIEELEEENTWLRQRVPAHRLSAGSA